MRITTGDTSGFLNTSEGTPARLIEQNSRETVVEAEGHTLRIPTDFFEYVGNAAPSEDRTGYALDQIGRWSRFLDNVLNLKEADADGNDLLTVKEFLRVRNIITPNTQGEPSLTSAAEMLDSAAFRQAEQDAATQPETLSYTDLLLYHLSLDQNSDGTVTRDEFKEATGITLDNVDPAKLTAALKAEEAQGGSGGGTFEAQLAQLYKQKAQIEKQIANVEKQIQKLPSDTPPDDPRQTLLLQQERSFNVQLQSVIAQIMELLEQMGA